MKERDGSAALDADRLLDELERPTAWTGFPEPLDDLSRARLVDGVVHALAAEVTRPARSRGPWPAIAVAAASLALVAVGLTHHLGRTRTPAAQLDKGATAVVHVNGRPVGDAPVVLVEGDTVSLTAGRTCVRLLGDVRVCMAEGSRIAITSAGDKARVIHLHEGQIVAELAKQPAGHSFAVTTLGLRATAVGTAFSVTRDARGSRAVVLTGQVLVTTTKDRVLLAAHEAVDDQAGRLQRLQVPAPQEQQAWQLLQSVSAPIAPATPLQPTPSVIEDAMPPAAPPPAQRAPARRQGHHTAPEIARLLTRARDAAAQGDWTHAADWYQQLRRHHPNSREAHTVLVALGEIALSHQREPARALQSFTAYLETGAGPLAQEARLGRVRALQRLSARAEEMVAIREYLRHHPHGAGAASLRERWSRLAEAKP